VTRRRTAVLRAAMAALALAIAASGCASLPRSGTIDIKSLHGSGGAAPAPVVVVPVPPGPDWKPTEIVEGFLAASASFANDYGVARQYLTPGYSKYWRPGWAAHVVSQPAISNASQPNQNAAGPLDAQVNVSSQSLAVMTTSTQYGAGTVRVSVGKHLFAFALTRRYGGWRISDIYYNSKQTPRSLVLLTQADFERVYEPRNLYYGPAEAASPGALVPEPAYIPELAPAREAVVGMVTALLSPLPATSWLSLAATTAFPRGTKLLSAQVIGVNAVVNLGGAALKTSKQQRQAMAAQLFWTLTTSPYPTAAPDQIRSVTLQFAGRTWKQLLPGYDSGGVPQAQAASLYFQAPGESPAQGIKVVADVRRPSKSGPATVNVPGGLGSGPFTAIAVTPGPQSQAVLAACRGKNIYLVPQRPGTAAVTRQLAARCTSLSWDASGNLWVAAGGLGYELPGAALGSAGKPAIVSVVCPTLPVGASITSLHVAPDGVRVATVVRLRSGGTEVLTAAISKSKTAGFTYLGQTGNMVQVGSDIAHPAGLAWLDPNDLVVLGQSGGRSLLYEVPLNGGSSTLLVGAPADAVSVTTSSPGPSGQPRIVVNSSDRHGAPGVIWISGPGLGRGWSPVAKVGSAAVLGSTPVFPG
jgi:Lipoprotein LpqB beta-propeller domain/Sporulation and spore germination